MKKLAYFILAIAIIMTGCDKNDESSANQAETFLRYEFNGLRIEAIGNLSLNFGPSETGVLCYYQYHQNAFQNSFYQIFSTGTYTIRLNFYVPVDSLQVTTYHMDLALYGSTIGNLSLNRNDTVYRLNRSLDYATINVTSYQDGKISGTFDCILSYHNVSSNTYLEAKVTKGVFQNVKIYR